MELLALYPHRQMMVQLDPANIIGLPPNVLLSSLSVTENDLYVIDENQRVYNSTDGFTWR